MYPHQYQRSHAKKQLRIRYGIRINRKDYKELVGKIKNRKSLIERSSWYVVTSWRNPKRSLWLVKFNERLLPVIYDKQTCCVVTVLPETVIKEATLICK